MIEDQIHAMKGLKDLQPKSPSKNLSDKNVAC